MKKAGQRRPHQATKRSTSERSVPTRKYLMQAPSTIGMSYSPANTNLKNGYTMMSSPNMMSTGNGGYMQMQSSGGAAMGQNQPAAAVGGNANGGYTQSLGNGNGGFSASPMLNKQISQPQMGGFNQSPYSTNQYGAGALQNPLQQQVMQSMSTPALMPQPGQQHAFGNGGAMTMPQPSSSPAAPTQLPPTDKMVTNCSMPSFADQMNAAYAAYEQQQKLYDQQQNDLLKQLYISHPYPGLSDAAQMDGGAITLSPTQFMSTPQPFGGQQQYQSAAKGQRSPYVSGGGASSPAQIYPYPGSSSGNGAGSGSGDSGNRQQPQTTQYNASASTMPKTIPPRNGLGDVTCYQQISSPFGDPKGYRCFISN